MNVKKWFLMMAAVAVCLMPLHAEYSDMVKKNFKIDPAKQLNINFVDIDGDVFVETHDQNEIIVRFEKILKGSKSSRKTKYFEGIQPKFNYSDNHLEVEIEYPRWSGLSGLFTGMKLKVVTRLLVPANTDLKVKLVDGDVNVDGLNGKINLRSVDGDLKINGCDGPIIMRTTDGDMHVNGCTGSLKIQTTDGDVKAGGVFKGLEFRSIDGDAHFTFKDGSQLQEDCKLRTTDGDIKLILPENLDFKTNIRTSDGRIRLGGFVFNNVTMNKKNKFSGEHGNAAYSFEIKAVDGSISFEEL